MVVYGSALIVRLFKGHFLLENGLLDVGYLLTTLVIAIPMITYVLFANNKVRSVIAFSIFMTGFLFFSVYAASVSADGALSLSESLRFSSVFLVITIILIITMHFSIHKNLSKRSF